MILTRPLFSVVLCKLEEVHCGRWHALGGSWCVHGLVSVVIIIIGQAPKCCSIHFNLKVIGYAGIMVRLTSLREGFMLACWLSSMWDGFNLKVIEIQLQELFSWCWNYGHTDFTERRLRGSMLACWVWDGLKLLRGRYFSLRRGTGGHSCAGKDCKNSGPFLVERL